MYLKQVEQFKFPENSKKLDFLGCNGYAVDINGNIWVFKCKSGTKTKRWKTAKNWKNKQGYIITNLVIDGKRKCFPVHRLVLLAFVGLCPMGMEACHKDNNPSNNCLDNLRWDTPKNNTKDRTLNGVHYKNTPRGSRHKMSKLDESQVLEIRKLYKYKNYSRKELSIKFSISYRNMCDIINRKIWRHI